MHSADLKPTSHGTCLYTFSVTAHVSHATLFGDVYLCFIRASPTNRTGHLVCFSLHVLPWLRSVLRFKYAIFCMRGGDGPAFSSTHFFEHVETPAGRVKTLRMTSGHIVLRLVGAYSLPE